ncbi:MAG: transporter substrate-binding domain-containing protein [Flavobacteriaceae bacterium]
MRYLLSCFFLFTSLTLSSQSETDTIKVGYTSAPPFVIENNEELTGINVWLWEQIAEDLDLNFEYVPMDFSAMLDSLETGGIDLSINPLTITGTRNKKMTFTHTYYAANSTVVVAETSSLEKFLQFVRAFFSLNFIKGLLVLLLIIFLFGLLGWYFERKKNPQHFRKGSKGIWDGVWWSAVTLTTVGYGDKAPKTRWGKVAALVLMFGGLLFISGLTASIASSLTVNQLSNDPDSFNEFKDRKVGSIKNTGTIQFLHSQFFKDVEAYEEVSAGLKAVKEGRIKAFMYDEPILKYKIKEDPSMGSLSILPVKFDVQFYAFGLPKDRRILKQTVSQRILEIIETKEWQIVLNEFGLTEI